MLNRDLDFILSIDRKLWSIYLDSMKDEQKDDERNARIDNDYSNYKDEHED
jgi:hypothetical protein